jgi:glycosyltransferase involved in cell wall biosynthesis
VPVVASDAVGQPEVVTGEWGALYPAGDRQALAEAITAILGRDDRDAMGRAGRAFAERNCDVRRQTAQLHALFAGIRTPTGG